MSDCKWAGRGNPRLLPGRHGDRCQGGYDPTEGEFISGCSGCLPCSEPHCRVCGFTHHDGTCAECMGEARANLHEIARLCGALPDEVEHRGVEGEAMVLLGPAADPEARGHLEASVACGRVPADYLAESHGETHPVFVLLSWQMTWRDALEHDEAPDSELSTAVDYLDRQMTYMGGYALVPFEDLARDLRKCVGHLEAVLHDQRQGDRANVGCFECGADLERRIGKEGFEDFWTCGGCRRRYTYPEYNFALRAKLEDLTEVTA